MALTYYVETPKKIKKSGGFLEIREGAWLVWGEQKENSPVSDYWSFWWGIEVMGKGIIWRNRFLKENDGVYFTEDEMVATAKRDTAQFLRAVADRIEK